MRTVRIAFRTEGQGCKALLLPFARALAVAVLMASALPAFAQSGIFSVFRPQQQEQQPEEPASPYADAADDHANWIATGAPLMLRPSEEQLRRAPRVVTQFPLPPSRPDAPVPSAGAGAPAQQAATTPPPAPPSPAPTAPAPASEEPEFPASDTPSARAFAALPPNFNRPLPTLAPPPVPERVTPEELEKEEQRTPEPSFVEKQTDYVNIQCLKPELMEVIQRAGQHFRGTPIITSGQRSSGRRGSYHRMCMAADFFIPGIERSTLASWLRRQPDAGGVGTYCHTKSVHVDIGDPRNWWQCGRRFSFALRG
jgi:hypothetical protein